MLTQEPSTVGLSKEGHEKLKLLKEHGEFAELLDAYRFAIALAIAQGVDPASIGKNAGRQTIFNVGSLDPDNLIRTSVRLVYRDACGNESVYKVAEKLAEWGVEELYNEANRGRIDFETLLEQAESSN